MSKVTITIDGVISIHALREESDIRFCGCAYTNNKISIHALREESDFMIKRLSKK